MGCAQQCPWNGETLRERTSWTQPTRVAILLVVLTFATVATTPVVADLDDDAETGPWAEDGSV
ncbi:MAG: hypothetical protein KAJ35_08650, partial [Thermoplasmata archaeon]|nr:hypothetical protein [Thermoplasmata archaeon]